jgi:hypothetical protein
MKKKNKRLEFWNEQLKTMLISPYPYHWCIWFRFYTLQIVCSMGWKITEVLMLVIIYGARARGQD